METVQEIPIGSVETPKPVVEPPPQRSTGRSVNPPTERTRRVKTTPYDKFGLSFAYTAAATLSAALWWVGAYFTIAALRSFGITVAGPVWWLLPAAVTAIEIWLMPRAGVRWQALAFFTVVLLVDVLSSWYGVIATLGGRFVPLGAGWTIPQDGTMLHIVAILVSLAFAFMPERLARWSLVELWKVWR